MGGSMIADDADAQSSDAAVEKLKLQIDAITRSIADTTKDLHDYKAQNVSLAMEIARLKKRAEDAERDATVLRANLVYEDEDAESFSDDSSIEGSRSPDMFGTMA